MFGAPPQSTAGGLHPDRQYGIASGQDPSAGGNQTNQASASSFGFTDSTHHPPNQNQPLNPNDPNSTFSGFNPATPAANSNYPQQQGPPHANLHQSDTDGTTYYGHHRAWEARFNQLPSASASGSQDPRYDTRNYFGQHAFGTPANPEGATGNFHASGNQSSTPYYQQPNGWQPGMSPYGSSFSTPGYAPFHAPFQPFNYHMASPAPAIHPSHQQMAAGGDLSTALATTGEHCDATGHSLGNERSRRCIAEVHKIHCLAPISRVRRNQLVGLL